MILVVLSEEDPVARGVARLLGEGKPTEWTVEGRPVRQLSPGLLGIERAILHIRDERLADALPVDMMGLVEAVVFPSVHRSRSSTPCLTVHPLGNLTDEAAVGGTPRLVNPAAARLMTRAFLRLFEEGRRIDRDATFEATHHGPTLPYPSFFIEAGSTESDWNDPRHHQAIVNVLLSLKDVEGTPIAPIVIGVGGGHYMPYFRDLVRRRIVAVGHLIPSHHLPLLTRRDAERIVLGTPGATGIVYAKAKERDHSPFDDMLLVVAEKELEPF